MTPMKWSKSYGLDHSRHPTPSEIQLASVDPLTGSLRHYSSGYGGTGIHIRLKI